MGQLPRSYKFSTPEKSMTIKPERFSRLDRELCGIYVFRGKVGECLYVGQSKSLRNRLGQHLVSSPFSRLIYTADIYHVENPFLREIFETVFIDEMRPHYNRAKAFSKHRARHDTLLYEIEALEGELLTLEEERAEIVDTVDRPQLDEELDYNDPYDDFTDEDEGLMYALGEELRFVERIPELDAEISAIKREIRRLYGKLS